MKTDLLQSSFVNKCSLLTNTSLRPTDYELFASESLSNINFTDNNIGRVRRSLDLSKFHGHDMMSICMLEICGDTIYNPLGLTFRDCLGHGVCPQNYKKANADPAHKKMKTSQ